MSNCIGCVCNACVYNADLDPQYFTPGEVDGVCFNCDDCMTTNGHSRWDEERGCWSGRWKGECDHFRKPAKKVEMEARIARAKLKVIGGNSRDKI